MSSVGGGAAEREASRPQPTSATQGPDGTYPSAEVLLGVALAEREHRLSAIGGLETKAGVLLGVAAALVTLSGGWDPWWARLLSGVLPLIAAGVALAGLWTRRVDALNVKAMRDDLVTGPPDKAALTALDMILDYDAATTNTAKTLRGCVRWSAVLVAAGTLVNFVLVIVNPQ